MGRTLTDQDVSAIAQEVIVGVEALLIKINAIDTTKTEDLLNIEQLSEKLKLSKQSVRRLTNEGQIKSIRIGKQIYVKQSDFINYINSKR
jgi:excisionase family DNA binding protein